MSFSKGGLKTGESHTLPFLRETYIRIRCVDEEGQPLKGRAYRLILPDGKGIMGKLDNDGWAKHEHIRPGECEFRLIDPDEVLVGPGAGGLHFINVVVKDEEGRVLVGEDYVLTLVNGETRKGTLDHEGRCLEEKIPAGPCFFALKGVKLEESQVRHMRLQFMDEDGDPFAGCPFVLKVGSEEIEGTTNDEGRVIADIRDTAEEGQLTIWVEGDKEGESFTWPIKISEVTS